ncbi:LysR family transcriptional regulator [Methyloprofundus sedimenti]|uniref:LysR family transcriptional regulator n=1 Tax=Methyloprofundus sedimenti TaxID=1420851 RepID=A0A1V8M8D1_9GAMM|nr:LysR family transcriptional regulator [Methyloprofundus sedimenti]OQK17831.1 LysR family transcriptional regulator [Methyloprofundus sedimenti]
MRATLHQLKIFQQVAELLNHSAAANKLNLTQPAVSIQIKQLENNLGLSLFEKIGKKIFLTSAGRELNHFCNDIFSRIDHMDMKLSAMKGQLEGEFLLAAVTSAKYFTPHLLGAFHKLHPKVSLHLEVANRSQTIQLLKKNEVDLVIMGMVPENMRLKRYPITENPIVIIANPSHPLALQRNIPCSELAKHTFIMRENGSGTRKGFENFLLSQNIKLTPSMILGSSETIKQAVIADLGISVLSRHSVALELATKCLVELDVQDFPLMRCWYVVHHETKQLSPAAIAFIDFILYQKETVDNLCNRFLETHFVAQ